MSELQLKSRSVLCKSHVSALWDRQFISSIWEKWSGQNRALGNIHMKIAEKKTCKENRTLRGKPRKRGVTREEWSGKYVLFVSEIDFEEEEEKRNVLWKMKTMTSHGMSQVCKVESSSYVVGRDRRLSKMFYLFRKFACVLPGKLGFIQVRTASAPWDCLQI